MKILNEHYVLNSYFLLDSGPDIAGQGKALILSLNQFLTSELVFRMIIMLENEMLSFKKLSGIIFQIVPLKYHTTILFLCF